MAMNGNSLGSAVVTAIQTVDPSMTSEQIAQLTSAWQAIGTAIVTYLTANMDVLPSGHTGPGLQNPIGQAVTTPAGPGSTSAPENITGLGSVQ